MMKINCWRYYARQDGHNGDDCLNGSRGSHCMAGHRLAGTDWYAVGVFAEASFDSLCLCPIIVRSRSAMSIDVVDLVGTQPCFLQGAPYSSHQSFSTWRRLGHVICVDCCAVTHQFRENLCSPGPGEIQLFQDEYTRAFAHHKAVACCIEGAAGSLRIIIAARESVHIIEGSHSNGRNPFFRPPSNHCTGIATANRFPGLSDGVAACSAGGNSGPVRSLRSCHNGDDARGPVDDYHVGEMRANAFRAFFKENFELVMPCR